MNKQTTIGILTGGGDSPGINAALRAIVHRALAESIEVIGFTDGWRGLIEDQGKPLRSADVSGILHVGGTMLGTSRTNPFHKVTQDDEVRWEPTDKIEAIKDTWQRRNLDALIAIGGDDTLGVTHRLTPYGMTMIGIPQTIDNDIAGTDYSIGFHSALVTVTEALDKLHTTAHAHHRLLILEVMGRDSGWIGLLGGLAGGADVLLVPESNFSVDTVEQQIRRRLEQGKRFSIVVIAEGAKPQELEGRQVARGEVDAFGHVQLGGVGYWLAEQLKAQGNLEMTPRVTVLAYLQRGGVATPFDRLLATRFGVAAVEFAMEGRTDVMTGLQGTQVVPVPLGSALAGTPKPLDPELLRVARSIGLS
ncbi:MAG: ATP-dependent 6-phosphofructokinase [Candidatus Bipolaricaulota bacterium]